LENASIFKNSRYKKSYFNETLSEILCGNVKLNKLYQERLTLDDEYYLSEYLCLPDEDFNYFYRKLTNLKSCLSLIKRIFISIQLMLLRPSGIKRRLISNFSFLKTNR